MTLPKKPQATKLSDVAKLLVNPNPTVQMPSAVKAVIADAEHSQERAKLLNQDIGEDDKGIHAHKKLSAAENARAHVSDKFYFFPESYNQLRKELYYNWPELWAKVGWAMAHDAVIFVQEMNTELGMTVMFDSQRVAAICQRYLDALHSKRGVRH